jgi:hypothetical protein
MLYERDPLTHDFQDTSIVCFFVGVWRHRVGVHAFNFRGSDHNTAAVNLTLTITSDGGVRELQR